MSDESKPDNNIGKRVTEVVDFALTKQGALVDGHVEFIRRQRPAGSPSDIVKLLNAELRAAAVGGGAGVGAAAAAPGVGTAVALALSAGEAVGFLNLTTLYVLSRASVHGVPVKDLERRRLLVMGVMLGDAGAKAVHKVAERTGQHWARQLVAQVPATQLKAINKILGRNFVTRYGTRQGIIVLGRVVPFGIGAAIGGGLNAVFAQGIIKAADVAFGPPPVDWPSQVEASRENATDSPED